MPEDNTDEKTIVLSTIEQQNCTTTSTTLEQRKISPKHTKKHTYKGISLLIIGVIIISVLIIYGYNMYEDRTKQSLTNNLINAIQHNDIKHARAIILEIKRHGYKSVDIDNLEKRLISMEQLDKAWEQAKQYYNTGMYKEAKGLIAGFTETSMYRDMALTMLEEIKQKELDSTIKSAISAYSKGDRAKAVKLINDVIEIDPANQQAHSLLSTIHQPVVKAKTPAHHTLANTSEDPGDKAYRDGAFDKALFLWSHSQKPGDTKKAIILTNIRKYMSIGERHLKDGDYKKAIESFNKILIFTGLIGITNKAFEHTINGMISDAYSRLGKAALTNCAYEQANVYFQRSIMFNPGNVQALQGFSTLNEEAEHLYKKAYVITDVNASEACKLYKQASLIAQKDTDVYKKIKEHLVSCEQ
ncbi:MAG: tetratricopeptide repeat protein [bacterium]